MRLRRPLLSALWLCAMGAFAIPALAQQTTGSLAGAIKDNSGASIPGAKVLVTNQEQGSSREITTGSDGNFFADPLQPATYTVTIEAQGFKKYIKRDIKLFANDHLSLGDMVLEVGAVNEVVSVEAQAIQLQTEDAMRSGVITGSQTVNLALNGRNYLDLVKTVPGIVSNFNGQVAGPGGIGDIFANGQRGNQNNSTLDGVGNMDTGSNGTQHTSLNIDAVAEFRVITNSESAEFGRSSGATINVITKSGTRDFHGTGYWFHRNEGLNANNWRNNVDGSARPKYRYNYQGYNIGGPVYIPGHFNTNREKLFFFFGQEFQRQLVPNTERDVTVPTADERNGNFSQTHDASGRPVIIRDPLTGLAFPGNQVPANRITADGQKILNFYPLPNVVGRPDYNYRSQVSSSYPRRQEIYRGDWNISDKWRFFARAVKDADLQIMPYGQWNASYNIPFGPLAFGQPGYSTIADMTTIINPTLTNEFVFGFSHNFLSEVPTTDAFSRSKLGLSFQMPFPNADKLGLVPNFHYDVPNPPTTDFAGTPFINYNSTLELHDNISKVLGAHRLKAGAFWQHSAKDQTATTSVNGIIDFGRDPANPGDTNWAFSNALLGNFKTLQQANGVLNGQYRYSNVEWYALDSWKVTPRLTVEYGMRFYWIQPQYDQALQTSTFNPGLFSQAQAPVLFQIGPRDSKGNPTGAINPLNGQLVPAVFIGALVPGTGKTTNGLYTNGIAQAGKGYPKGLIEDRGVHYAPRLGVAWNISDKTVIRAGGGVFYDRFQGNPVFDMLPNPPSTLNPIIYYGNIATAAQTPGVSFPSQLHGFSEDGHVPTTYNWNIGVQRELPWRVLLDVAYVGSRNNHLLYEQNYNALPFGSASLPQNQDLTRGTPQFNGTTTLPANFYRPFPGYADIFMYGFGASSNYNALQVAVNRRLATNFQFGFAYTYSKALGIANADTDVVNPLNYKKANYGPLSFDRTHVAVLNYIYDLPKPARNSNFLDNVIGRAVLNNWVVSGISTFATGLPDQITYNVQNVGSGDLNRAITGSETVAPRVSLSGNPMSGGGGINEFVNPSVFHPAAPGSTGMDSALYVIRKPGYQNWDLSAFKRFPFWREGKAIELRVEAFNVWNHTQFSDFNRTITFDAAGHIANLPTALGGTGGRFGFGALTTARDPRIIQLATKIYF